MVALPERRKRKGPLVIERVCSRNTGETGYHPVMVALPERWKRKGPLIIERICSRNAGGTGYHPDMLALAEKWKRNARIRIRLIGSVIPVQLDTIFPSWFSLGKEQRIRPCLMNTDTAGQVDYSPGREKDGDEAGLPVPLSCTLLIAVRTKHPDRNICEFLVPALPGLGYRLFCGLCSVLLDRWKRDIGFFVQPWFCEDIDVDAPEFSIPLQVVFRDPVLVVVDGEPVGELVGRLVIPLKGWVITRSGLTLEMVPVSTSFP